MNGKRHILVTDSTSEKPSNIVFLLKLAGYRVSEFADELEACNWLLQQFPTLRPAHLLLLNEPHPERSLFSLLFQMRQRFPTLEILLVAPKKLTLHGLITGINPPIRQCACADIHNLVRHIFSLNSATLDPQQQLSATNDSTDIRIELPTPGVGMENL